MREVKEKVPAQVIFFSFRSLHQFSSVAQSCPTLCNPMNRSTPSLPVHHQLPEFTQTHIHWVGDTIQPSHPLSSPFPPAPKFTSGKVNYIQVISETFPPIWFNILQGKPSWPWTTANLSTQSILILEQHISEIISRRRFRFSGGRIVPSVNYYLLRL